MNCVRVTYITGLQLSLRYKDIAFVSKCIYVSALVQTRERNIKYAPKRN